MEDNINNIPVIEAQENNVPLTEAINPIEQYNFSFTKKDGEVFGSDHLRRFIIRTAVFSAFLILLSLDDITVTTNGVTSAYPAAPVFLGILALYLIIKSVFLIRILKHRKLAGERLDGANYRYNFYPTRIEVIRTKDGEPETTENFDFRDIKRLERKENYIRILANNKYILLKENEIPPESPFLYYINTSPLTKNLKAQSKYYVVSLILFFAALFSFFFATSIIMPKIHGISEMESLKFLYLFIPIPLISLAFGIYATKKGYRCIKNIVIGIIISVMLFLFGSIPFMFGNFLSETPDLYVKAEELTGIDLPDYTSITTTNWTISQQTTAQGYIFTSTDIRIKNLDSESFRSRISRDDRWLETVPTSLTGIASTICLSRHHDYVLIYNIDTGEYNTLPDENGTYRFMNIIFNNKSNSITIVDYEIEYIK